MMMQFKIKAPTNLEQVAAALHWRADAAAPSSPIHLQHRVMHHQ